MDLSYLLEVACAKFPERTAVVCDGQGKTYAELNQRVDDLAAGIASITQPGARVATLLLNEIDTIALYLAIARSGRVNVPINYRLNAAEVAYIVEDCSAQVIFAERALLDASPDLRETLNRLDQIVEVGGNGARGGTDLSSLIGKGGTQADSIDEGSDAGIIYSSGTSGFPKGVVRSHRANLWGAVNAFIGSPRSSKDVELFALPLFGIGFVAQVLPTLLAGATVVLDTTFSPTRAWELLERYKVTRAFLAPTMIAAMLEVEGHENHDVGSIETLCVAYEFPKALRERAVERFGEVFLNMYGLTEAQLCCTSPGEFSLDPTSVGRPMGLARVLVLGEDGQEASIGTPGEIVFEGPTVMTRYHGKDEATLDALSGDRLRSGDLGYLDEERRLHFTGRIKEIVKSGGFNIDPVEVESVLQDYPGVREAALIGVPDERWGERAVAYIAADGAVEIPSLIGYCRQRLAGFKVPKEVFVLSELPKNATGKIHRAALRSRNDAGVEHE
jgi:acyl-CoA synthetase (AMP-forming)/AMP-acid ligase II